MNDGGGDGDGNGDGDGDAQTETTNASNEDLSIKQRDVKAEVKREISSSSSGIVAEHYNAVPQKGIAERTTSRIFYLRNFNNWIKSMLIAEFLERLQNEGCIQATVLDLCCGKGGDFLKWRIGNVAHVVATDIASVSLEQCEKRYSDMKAREDRRRPLFSAEFIVADATKDRLMDHYFDRYTKFDLCSCQFSLHYCFESEQKARRMLQNAVERLKPGGYFIGTLPDAERIMYCIKNSKDGIYTNDVVRLMYGEAEALKDDAYRPPIFGALIHFSLDTQVNCPEYLVHFPVLERLLADCGLELVYKKRFPDAFEYYMNERNGRALLGRMQALEPYPPVGDVKLIGPAESYEFAAKKRKGILEERPEEGHTAVGTLSKDEWEVASLYLVFAFRKKNANELMNLPRTISDFI